MRARFIERWLHAHSSLFRSRRQRKNVQFPLPHTRLIKESHVATKKTHWTEGVRKHCLLVRQLYEGCRLRLSLTCSHFSSSLSPLFLSVLPLWLQFFCACVRVCRHDALCEALTTTDNNNNNWDPSSPSSSPTSSRCSPPEAPGSTFLSAGKRIGCEAFFSLSLHSMYLKRRKVKSLFFFTFSPSLSLSLVCPFKKSCKWVFHLRKRKLIKTAMTESFDEMTLMFPAWLLWMAAGSSPEM